MARQSQLLSDLKLRAWIAAGKAVAKSDGDGLTFTFSSVGVAAWTLRYRVGGRRRELTLGRYPDVSLKAARVRAAAERVRVATGVDVAAEKRRSRYASISTWTVRQLVEDYEAKTLAAAAPSTRKLYRGYLANWVKPRLGAMLATDATIADVVAMLRAVSVRGAGAMRTLHVVTRNVFEHARGQAIRADNPAVAIKLATIMPAPKRRQGYALSGDALADFVRAIPEDVKGWALKVHLLTGVRPGELSGAEWDEFDGNEGTWTLPPERTKMGTGYTIRLPVQALGVLRQIAANSIKSPFVFPAARGDEAPIPYQTYRAWLWIVLDRLGWDRKLFKPHDLRRTMRSGLSALGVRYEVAERAINHRLPDLAEIYDRNDYAEARAQALAQWADYLDSLQAEATVTPIRRKASLASL